MMEEYVTTEPGVRLFVQTLGNGPQLIAIPNGYYLFDALSRFAEGRTLVFFDPRNRGRSEMKDRRTVVARTTWMRFAGTSAGIDCTCSAIRTWGSPSRCTRCGIRIVRVESCRWARWRPIPRSNIRRT